MRAAVDRACSPEDILSDQAHIVGCDFNVYVFNIFKV
jgi:hypothetical protein